MHKLAIFLRNVLTLDAAAPHKPYQQFYIAVHQNHLLLLVSGRCYLYNTGGGDIPTRECVLLVLCNCQILLSKTTYIAFKVLYTFIFYQFVLSLGIKPAVSDILYCLNYRKVLSNYKLYAHFVNYFEWIKSHKTC